MQYVSIRYTQRLAGASIGLLVSIVGDSCDNALAETINRSYMAEVIHRHSRKTPQEVKQATLDWADWADWFNHKRPLGPIRNIPPAQIEAACYRQ